MTVEFLQQVDEDQLMDLHRSNLLRLSSAQLLESITLARPPSKAIDLVNQVSDFFTKSLSRKKIPLVSSTPFADLGAIDAPAPSRDDPASGRLFLPRLDCCAIPAVGGDHSSAALSTSLLTKASGNAQVPPTLQLHVLLPSSFFAPKDFAKHRYFQVRPWPK
jgi:hypothetical protein